ncbi:hypothetical protein BC834DRAFT_34122 [Gloeopeniophorella convolvens]|nr:hypothetical protein BC834DRAFT_34122 [Gloeopeniophorella convolvens]
MSLNLQPGQILQSSIYQPIRAPPFPLERAPATYPPDRYTRSTRMPPSRPTADYDPTDSGSPPRRNQTLSALNPAREPPEQSYHAPPPARPEAHAYQHRSHPAGSDIYQPQPPLRPSTDSQHNIAPPRPDQRRMSQMSRYPQEAPSHSVSVNSAPAQPSEPSRMPTRHSPRVDTFYDTGVSSQPVIVAPPAPLEPPPTPDIDQRLSRTLYLTNPDVPRPDTPEYFSHVPPVIPTSGRMRASRDQRHPPQTQVDSFYGVQPQPQPLSAPPAAQEGRRHSPPRASPPAASTPPRQGSPRRYEPPSQTLATINGQRSAGPPSVMSAPSSTLTTSSLAPRHIPKRLVMPTPLAATAENTPPHVPSPPPTRRAGPSPVPPPAPAPARANAGDPRRPGHLLRKRSAPGGMQAPRRIPEPPRTETRGVLAFFGFGKSSKAPVVRQVRVAEPPAPPRREMRERQQQQQQQQQQRVRAPAEVRKLSKRK